MDQKPSKRRNETLKKLFVMVNSDRKTNCTTNCLFEDSPRKDQSLLQAKKDLSSKLVKPKKYSNSPIRPLNSSLPKATPKQKVAFFSSEGSTSPRVSKQNRMQVPSVGLYTPKPAYQIQSKSRFYVSKSPSHRLKETQLQGPSNLNGSYTSLQTKKNTFDMSKQLPRKTQYKSSVQKQETFLEKPSFVLPPHLKKFNGIYYKSHFTSDRIEDLKGSLARSTQKIYENMSEKVSQVLKMQKKIKRRNLEQFN